MDWVYGFVLACGVIAIVVWQLRNSGAAEDHKPVQYAEPPDHLGEALRQRASRQASTPRKPERD
jgi:hypothetical protein